MTKLKRISVRLDDRLYDRIKKQAKQQGITMAEWTRLAVNWYLSVRSQSRKQALRELAATVAEIRQEAKEKGIDKMPMSEIRAAVTAARRDLKKTR
jgi:hypothetical protein